MLYDSFKYELGCPGESACELFKDRQLAACGPCAKHLKPVEPAPNPITLRFIRLLLWAESLIAAGCAFRPDELPVSVWEGLASLKSERNRFERLLYETRDGNNKADAALEKAKAEARRQDGLPGVGQSIFGKKGR